MSIKRIIKRNQIETMKSKSIKMEMQISLQGFNSIFEQVEKKTP